jgi:cysteinyl-tRNA synthetase
MNELRVYNTLSRRKEAFQPSSPGAVKMYVCGVTVYDYCHLGHARCYVAFDAIRRYLQHRGYAVTYIQNITDIDDKIIARARREGGAGEIKERVRATAERFAAAYAEDMSRLSVLPADSYPKATENIPGMQAIIAGLMEKGIAYKTAAGVFFSVDAFPAYGELSRRNLEDMQAGARVKVNEEKKNPLDFALWKAAAPDEPSWESPWGPGRPGWHIECSAMSMNLLGPSFDIHGGGQDLIFPHHENEKAQSEAFTGKPFVRYWLHNGFITINQEKMSKSLGNVANLRELFNAFSPRVLRHFLLGTHYRSPIDFSSEGLSGARSALTRLDNCRRTAEEAGGALASSSADPAAMAAFSAAMDDDFNTAAAIGIMHSLANAFFSAPGAAESRAKVAALLAIGEILGLPIGDERTADEGIVALAQKRADLRKEKKWVEADEIRKKLLEAGVAIRDRPDGTFSLVYSEKQKGSGE